MEENINTELEYVEALKKLIKETIEGICEKNINTFPNICRYGSRSEIDKNDLADRVLKYMTNSVLPLHLDSALNMVDCELESGFGE
jgi:hypothetical protein